MNSLTDIFNREENNKERDALIQKLEDEIEIKKNKIKIKDAKIDSFKRTVN